MNRIALFICIFLCTASVSSGQNFPLHSFPYPIETEAASSPQTDKAGGSLWVNYHKTDQGIFGNSNFQKGLVRVNSRSNTPVDSTGAVVKYIVCTFDTIIDSTLAFSYPYAQVSNLVLDSIRIQFGHESLIGNMDTLILEVVLLDTSSFPTHNVMWADTSIFIAGQSPSNQWTNTVIRSWAPMLPLPHDTAVGIKIHYYGAPSDTFGIVNGFGTDNQTCGSYPYPKPLKSNFYPNSYAYWTYYGLLLPTQTLGDLYSDCDADLEFDSLGDGANYIQNWDIGVLLSSPQLNVSEISDDVNMTVFPNPASSYIRVHSSLDLTHSSYSITSLDGRRIHQAAFTGNPINLATFANGIYLLEIKNSNWHVTKKILIAH